jgi:hypothetical protein
MTKNDIKLAILRLRPKFREPNFIVLEKSRYDIFYKFTFPIGLNCYPVEKNAQKKSTGKLREF